LTPRSVLGENLQATIAPVTLYVNNLIGIDTNDGLTVNSPKASISGAIAALPPVLRHPCVIQLIATGQNYSIYSISSSGKLETIPLGDGNIVSEKWYALANIAFSVQASGRLVISSQTGVTTPIIIDATGFGGFGDGPTSAFFVDTTRVIFNNIQFQGFTNPSVYGINADIEFVDCVWINNLTAGSFEQGCGVVLDSCSIQLGSGQNGIILADSQLTVASPTLVVTNGTTPGVFFVAERQSNMTLQTHSVEPGTTVPSSTIVANAQINSSIVCNSDWQTNGSAVLSMNSALSRTALITPFLGGITADASSSVVTNV